jgi:rhodanese-related sulfurtransferase
VRFVPKDRPKYLSLLWDQETYSNYRSRGKNKKGIIVFDERPAPYEINTLLYKNLASPLMGYYPNTMDRVDAVLRGAREILVRGETEPVNGVNCFVIDGKTKYGNFTVWIDPEHGHNIARAKIEMRRDEGHLYMDDPTESDVSFYLDVLRFEKVDAVWVCVEGTWEIWYVQANGVTEGGTTGVAISDIVLNPDHEALGSFVRDDVGSGTWGWIAPHYQIKYTWQDGEFRPQFDGKVVGTIHRTMRALLLHGESGSDNPVQEEMQSAEYIGNEANEFAFAEGQVEMLSADSARDDAAPGGQGEVEEESAGGEHDAEAEKRRVSHPHCGLYCVYGMAVLLDKDISFSSLVKPEYLGHADGSSLRELYKAAVDSGLHAKPAGRLSRDGLRHSPYPAILHVRSHPESPKYDHYTLFLGTEKDKAKLFNPPEAPRLVSFADLATQWDGMALFISNRPIDSDLIFAADRQRLVYCAMIGVLVVLAAHFGKHLWLVAVPAIPRRWALGLTTGQAAALGLAALLCAGAYHFFRDEGLLANAGATQALQKGHATSFIPKVTKSRVQKLLGTGTVFIDARRAVDFERGHLNGAINLPVDANDAVWKEALANIPPTRAIVAYCQSAGCKFAENVSLRLIEEGYRNVVLFPGGWAQWVARDKRPQGPVGPREKAEAKDAEQDDPT